MPTAITTTKLTTTSSGFDRDDAWGYRAVEPNRCCLSSIALVHLKTGITNEASSDVNPSGVSVDQAQMTTAQKLLLFWRKPAVGPRICGHSHSNVLRIAQVLVGWHRG